MARILCIGEALIDMICTDKGQPLSRGENFLKKAGGAPTNVAAAVAALGGQSSISAAVGKDPFGDHLSDLLADFGVDTSLLVRTDAFTTLAFVSLMPDGERDFYFSRGADAHLSKKDVDAIDLHAFDIVHFGSATAFLPGALQDAYKLAFEKAIAHDRYITFDPNYRHLLYRDCQPLFVQQCAPFIAEAHFSKFSDEEAMLITATSSLSDAAGALLNRCSGAFAITLGREGTLFGADGSLTEVPAVPVHAVDTTGAGDAFVGSVLYSLSLLPAEQRRTLSRLQWTAIVHRANGIAARACEHMGAMESFRHLTQS